MMSDDKWVKMKCNRCEEETDCARNTGLCAKCSGWAMGELLSILGGYSTVKVTKGEKK